MQRIIDIHTHHPAPCPEALVSVSPKEFSPVEGQLYSVGIHPWDVPAGVSEDDWRLLEEVAAHPQVAAIGECGIDMVKGGPLFRQMQVFRRQAELAERVGKPLVAHCVKGHDVIIGLRKDIKPQQPWAIHGFRGKPSVAHMLLDAGLWLSFGPLFNAESLGIVPADRILAETDESDTSIEEVISRLAVALDETPANLTDSIVINSAKFLSL